MRFATIIRLTLANCAQSPCYTENRNAISTLRYWLEKLFMTGVS